MYSTMVTVPKITAAKIAELRLAAGSAGPLLVLPLIETQAQAVEHATTLTNRPLDKESQHQVVTRTGEIIFSEVESTWRIQLFIMD